MTRTHRVRRPLRPAQFPPAAPSGDAATEAVERELADLEHRLDHPFDEDLPDDF